MPARWRAAGLGASVRWSLPAQAVPAHLARAATQAGPRWSAGPRPGRHRPLSSFCAETPPSHFTVPGAGVGSPPRNSRLIGVASHTFAVPSLLR